MSKRKGNDENDKDDGDVQMAGSGSGDSDSEMETVNVDFEMFDPQAEHDFHGLRNLLRQLFGEDSVLFDLSALTNLILSQPLLGTTVKVDGNTSDPYAFLTVINLHEHRENPAVKTLVEYLLAKSASSPVLQAKLQLFTSSSPPGSLGLILTERLVNMPTELVPPMYKMISEEIEWAVQDGEPYDFGAYLIVSKTYVDVESQLDRLEKRPSKMGKKSKVAGKKKGTDAVMYFHPEDEVTMRRVGEELCADYKYTKLGEASDSKRAFSDTGIAPQGLMMLVEKKDFESLVGDLEKMFEPDT